MPRGKKSDLKNTALTAQLNWILAGTRSKWGDPAIDIFP